MERSQKKFNTSREVRYLKMNNNLYHIKDLDTYGLKQWLKESEKSGQIKWDEFHCKSIKSHLEGKPIKYSAFSDLSHFHVKNW